jgi:ferredoxin
MSFSVTNQHNNSIFTTHQDETILDAALRDNRIYPYGCRSGVCGACKSNLVSGQVDYGDYEDFALTDEEKEQGKVLICQGCQKPRNLNLSPVNT